MPTSQGTNMAIGFPPSFGETCVDLKDALEVHGCEVAKNIAQPYIDAHDWESQTGKGIAEAVGLNSATDMQLAVSGLTDFVNDCKGCDSERIDCPLAQIEEKMQPLDLVERLKLINQ